MTALGILFSIKTKKAGDLKPGFCLNHESTLFKSVRNSNVNGVIGKCRIALSVCSGKVG